MTRKLYDLQAIKLMSGESIVADVVEETDSYLLVVNPIIIYVDYAEDGPKLVSSMWIPLTKVATIIKLQKSHVIVHYNVNKIVNDCYIRTIEKIVASIIAPLTKPQATEEVPPKEEFH